MKTWMMMKKNLLMMMRMMKIWEKVMKEKMMVMTHLNHVIVEKVQGDIQLIGINTQKISNKMLQKLKKKHPLKLICHQEEEEANAVVEVHVVHEDQEAHEVHEDHVVKELEVVEQIDQWKKELERREKLIPICHQVVLVVCLV